jgi:hypothetical protein
VILVLVLFLGEVSEMPAGACPTPIRAHGLLAILAAVVVTVGSLDVSQSKIRF